jgi:predicted MFS family arabinose efflux permease
MIIIMFTYNFAMKGIYSYLGILVGDFGGGALSLGLTYFFDASPEIITFFLADRLLKKFHSKNLILVAFVLQIIRLTVILIFNNAIAVISMGVLSGFAFGLVAASYKTYIYNLAPAMYKASCLSLAESIIGLSAIISAPIFGFVFVRFGTNSAILFGLIINIIAALVMVKDVLSK